MLNLVQHFPSIGWCLTNRKTHTTNSMIELMMKQALAGWCDTNQ
jgi:hypothetical protein